MEEVVRFAYWQDEYAFFIFEDLPLYVLTLADVMQFRLDHQSFVSNRQLELALESWERQRGVVKR